MQDFCRVFIRWFSIIATAVVGLEIAAAVHNATNVGIFLTVLFVATPLFVVVVVPEVLEAGAILSALSGFSFFARLRGAVSSVGIPYALGIVYSLVLLIGWKGHGQGLMIMTICLAGIAALSGSWLQAASGAYPKWVLWTMAGLVVVAGTCVWKARPSGIPNNAHETSKRIAEGVDIARNGPAKAEHHKNVRQALEAVDNALDSADDRRLKNWATGAQAAAAAGTELPPMPRPVVRNSAHSSVVPGWIVSHDGRFKLTVLENDEWLKATFKAVDGKLVHLDWRRDDGWLTYWYEDLSIPVGKPGREGRGVECAIKWAPTKGAWIGNDPKEDGAFLIYPAP